MKTIKIISLFCAVLMSCALASCDKINEPDATNGNIVNGDYEVGVWYEDGNQLIYVLEYDLIIYKYRAKWVLTFDSNDLCIKSVCEYTFSDATMAQLFYEDLLTSEENVTKSGNTITVDMTDDHRGLSKDDMKILISYM